MATYNGFSTFRRNKKYRVTDFELAKQDLYNHLHIRKGEKLMNPDFGTIIWSLLFEPLTTEIKTAITDDLNTIVSYDPRLAVDAMSIAEFGNGIQVQLELRYIPTNQTDLLKIRFDKLT